MFKRYFAAVIAKAADLRARGIHGLTPEETRAIHIVFGIIGWILVMTYSGQFDGAVPRYATY